MALSTENPLLYTPEAAGKVCSLSKAKITDLVNKGEIEAFRVGTRICIPASALEAWIARRMAEQKPGA